jgi:hypothetical protein
MLSFEFFIDLFLPAALIKVSTRNIFGLPVRMSSQSPRPLRASPGFYRDWFTFYVQVAGLKHWMLSEYNLNCQLSQCKCSFNDSNFYHCNQHITTECSLAEQDRTVCVILGVLGRKKIFLKTNLPSICHSSHPQQLAQTAQLT